jgi:hypothetical protein
MKTCLTIMRAWTLMLPAALLLACGGGGEETAATAGQGAGGTGGAAPHIPAPSCATEPSMLLDREATGLRPLGAFLAGDTVFSVWSPLAGSDKKPALYRSSLTDGSSSMLLESSSHWTLLRATEERLFLGVSEIFGESELRLVRIDVYRPDATLERSVNIPEELSNRSVRVLADRVVIGGDGEILEEKEGIFSLLLTSDTSEFLTPSIPSEENAWVTNSQGRRACRLAPEGTALTDCFDLPETAESYALHRIHAAEKAGDTVFVWALGDQGYHFLRIGSNGLAEQILASKHTFSLNAFALLGADVYWFEQRDVSMSDFKTTVRRFDVSASVELDGQAWLAGLRVCEDAATREGVAPVKNRGIARFPLP